MDSLHFDQLLRDSVFEDVQSLVVELPNASQFKQLLGFKFSSLDVMEDTQRDIIDNAQIVNVKGDGNCLFRALAVLQSGNEEDWKDVKDLMRAHVSDPK